MKRLYYSLMAALSRYIRASWLPASLILLFVVQNLFFNSWVHLTPNPDPSFFVIECITLAALFYGPAVLFGGWPRYVYLLLVSLPLSGIFISQYIYFSLFGGFLQASAFEYAGQLNAEWGTVFALLSPRLLVFVLNIALVLAALFFTRKGAHWKSALLPGEKAIASAVVIVMVVGGYALLIASGGNGWQEITHPTLTLHDLNSFTYSPDQTVQQIGICDYYFGDIIGTVLRGMPVTEADEQFAQNTLAQKPAIQAGPYFGVARGEDLIYIQVESLETAVIGESVDGQEITPRLNALAKQGLYFDNYYTQVGPGNTADAEFVTLDSLYPLTNTVAFIDFAHNTYSALPALLAHNGYTTYALHGDVPDFWNRANIYPGLGYENQISESAFTATETGFPTLDDDDFLSQAAQKMASFKQPFMATVITLSSHTPFIIPAKYQALQFSKDPTLTQRQKEYLQSIHYTDAALGAFIDELQAEGITDHALIAIFGDHGSSTDISSEIGTSTDTTLPALSNSHVPLILLSPKLNAKANGVTATPGSHLDLYPTVADLLGIKPPQTVFGQDLLSTRTPVVTHRDPYSAIITTILTPKLVYNGADNGVFGDGTCVQLPASTTLPVSACQGLFDQQSGNIKASDLIIRGNLIPQLLTARAQ
jgi:lipoteichoic acid synthase